VRGGEGVDGLGGDEGLPAEGFGLAALCGVKPSYLPNLSPCERSFCPAEEIGPILTVYLILVHVSAKTQKF